MTENGLAVRKASIIEDKYFSSNDVTAASLFGYDFMRCARAIVKHKKCVAEREKRRREECQCISKGKHRSSDKAMLERLTSVLCDDD